MANCAARKLRLRWLQNSVQRGKLVDGDECAKQADYCRMQARLTKYPDHADRWNRIADEWEFIAKMTRQVAKRVPTRRLVRISA